MINDIKKLELFTKVLNSWLWYDDDDDYDTDSEEYYFQISQIPVIEFVLCNHHVLRYYIFGICFVWFLKYYEKSFLISLNNFYEK